MPDALEMLNVLKAVDVEAIAIATLEESEETMADLNTQQLAAGLRSDGSRIKPEYSGFTISEKEKKQGLAGVFDHVTLFDTGENYEEMYAEVQGKIIEWGSHDEKSADLQKKYDKKNGSIYGNTEESRDKLINGPVGDSWQKKIESATGLKFSK